MKRSNFEGKVVARVCSIYDGDTLDLAFFYRGKITRKACRMYGIDTPEMKMKRCATDTPKIIEQKMAVKQLAIEAKQYLYDQVMNPPSNSVVAVIGDNDKYGRPMVLLFRINEKHHPDAYFTFKNSINNELVQKGLAKLYDGTTKEEW